MSALLTHLLVQAARPRLIPSKLSHVSQPSEGLLILSLYGPDGETRHLGFSLRLGNPLFFLAPKRPPAKPKPTNFVMSLRKHLEAARLSALEQSPGERLARFRFRTPGGEYLLVYEGLSKYPNLILVGPDNSILSAVRYLNDVERPVLPQAPYAPPPHPKDKPNLWDLDGAALETLSSAVAPADRARWIRVAFRGSDIELSAHLSADPLGPGKAWDALRSRLGSGWGPLEVEAGPPPVLRLFPQGTGRLFDDPLEAASFFLGRLDSHEAFLSVRRRLEQEIRTSLKREKRLLEKLKGDRAEAERADQYQWWGELIMAHLHAIPPHQTEVELEDLARGTGGSVRVRLDPGLTPLDNARKFFRKSQKGERGLSRVAEREREVKERVERLKGVQHALPALTTADEARQAWDQLFKAKPVEKKPPPPREAKTPTPNVTRRRLDKSWELVAGSSAAANDYVTFQLAQSEDLWFHARDFPGSHVILRRLQRDTPVVEAHVMTAAREAASRSKAPPGSKVTVSYTERKYVKRIPGMAAGLVTFSKERSLVVESRPR